MDNKKFLSETEKLKKGLAMIRANPDIPHKIQMPDGSVIDLLDGETENLLDEMMLLAGMSELKSTDTH